MVLKHEAEAKILQSSKMYDAALKEQDMDKLGSLVDPNYTIHADGITLKVHSAQMTWLHCFCKVCKVILCTSVTHHACTCLITTCARTCRLLLSGPGCCMHASTNMLMSGHHSALGCDLSDCHSLCLCTCSCICSQPCACVAG